MIYDQFRRRVWQLDIPTSLAENLALSIESPEYLHRNNANNILVVSDGGLGDAVHLLPSLWLIRMNFPNAKLHVAIGFEEFFTQVTPWVDLAWPRLHQNPLQNFSLVRKIRREEFAAVFSVTWHSNAVFVAGLSGAPLRTARRAPQDECHWWHSLLLTFQMQFPLQSYPMYFQQWMCMRQAGFTGSVPEFVYQIKQQWLDEISICKDDYKTYVHVSPFTSQRCRDLPAWQTVEILNHLHLQYGRVVITSDATASSIATLKEILSKICFVPWRVFAGTLRIHQFIALIDSARLHIGGDTGSLHVSRLVSTPSVSWFRKKFGNIHWIPAATELQHNVIISADPRVDALHGIASEKLFALVDITLKGS